MFSFLPSLYLLATSLFFINEPVVTMRENPKNNSRVVSQALFSEKISIEKELDDWVFVATSDQYSGWIPKNFLVIRDEPYHASLMVTRLAAHLYKIKDTEFGPFKTLPYGSKLESLDLTDLRWVKISLPDGSEGYIQKGDVAFEQEIFNKKDLILFSQKFLGLPYTWGGRSSFGFDCSGFVQMLYNQIGINLQRDSKQQVLDSRFRTISINDLEPGDLIFFGRSQHQILHVGMYLGNGQFIHATSKECQPWIRISHLTDFEWSGSSESVYQFRIFRQLIV